VVVLDFDDFTGSHGAEPFANVAFVAARSFSELRARAGGDATKGLKETGAMSNGDHQTQRAMVEDFEIARAEFVETFGRSFGFAS
jgi:hypothetical protein